MCFRNSQYASNMHANKHMFSRELFHVIKRYWNVSLEHRRSHKQHRYICSNNQQYTVWVEIIHFYFMPKIIRYYVKIMFHEDILLISYLKYIKT